MSEGLALVDTFYQSASSHSATDPGVEVPNIEEHGFEKSSIEIGLSSLPL